MKVLLDRFDATSAEQAGIQLADKPSPLYQLLMLSTLLSARISGDIAVATAKELFAAGYRTPQRMRAATWQDRVDALGRGDPKRIRELLTEFKGMGPVGADIFLREVQAVWPQVAPYVDGRVTQGAEKVGLPSSAHDLSELVDSSRELARLSSARVQVSRAPRAAEVITSASE